MLSGLWNSRRIKKMRGMIQVERRMDKRVDGLYGTGRQNASEWVADISVVSNEKIYQVVCNRPRR